MRINHHKFCFITIQISQFTLPACCDELEKHSMWSANDETKQRIDHIKTCINMGRFDITKSRGSNIRPVSSLHYIAIIMARQKIAIWLVKKMPVWDGEGIAENGSFRIFAQSVSQQSSNSWQSSPISENNRPRHSTIRSNWKPQRLGCRNRNHRCTNIDFAGFS